jgi:hypothetical protein
LLARLNEVFLAGVVGEIDRQAHAAPGGVVADPPGTDEDHRGVRAKLGIAAGRVQPHPSATDHQAVAVRIGLQRHERQLRTRGQVPPRVGRLDVWSRDVEVVVERRGGFGQGHVRSRSRKGLAGIDWGDET